MKFEAMKNINPAVVTVIGDVAYDANEQVIEIDQAAYEAELARLEAEAIAQAEAKEALRQSMISKLAATLTPEETALLEELL